MLYLKNVFMKPDGYRGILIRIFLFGLFISLYDVLLHTLFVLLHFTFEWIEFTLEKIIEHTFHTNRKQSQLIVFYLLWLTGFYGFYRLIIILYRTYNSLRKQLFTISYFYQINIAQQWAKLTSIQKLKWTTSVMTSLFFVVFTLM